MGLGSQQLSNFTFHLGESIKFTFYLCHKHKNDEKQVFQKADLECKT